MPIQASVSRPWSTTITLSGMFNLPRIRFIDYILVANSSHVRFSPNSKFLLAATQDSTIRLWNFQTSRCVKTYTGHTNRTYCIVVCFSTIKGTYVISGSEDAKVYIWDLQSRKLV